MLHKVSAVAKLSSVSVRTLHYYDEIGLLKPSTTTEAGYRLYSDADLQKFQQILFYRALGFSLDRIGSLMTDPRFDRLKALKTQRKMLRSRRTHLDRLIRTIERTIHSYKGDSRMKNKDLFKGFDMNIIEEHQRQHDQETEKLYGRTEAYAESQRRTRGYTKADWARVMARGQEVLLRIAGMMDRPVSDPEVRRAVGQWRDHITESFYNCTPEIFRGLGELYVADARFMKNIDTIKAGLARYLSEAIRSWCDTRER